MLFPFQRAKTKEKNEPTKSNKTDLTRNKVCFVLTKQKIVTKICPTIHVSLTLHRRVFA